MRHIIVLTVAILLGGCGVRPCREGTVRIEVQYNGVVADQTTLVAEFNGQMMKKDLPRPAANIETIEVEFSSAGYTAGATLSFEGTALKDGVVVGVGHLTVTLLPGCTTATLQISGVSNTDAGIDLATNDLSTSTDSALLPDATVDIAEGDLGDGGVNDASSDIADASADAGDGAGDSSIDLSGMLPPDLSKLVVDMAIPVLPDMAMPLADMSVVNPPDLSMPPPDLATPPDLAVTADLAKPLDLAKPPDLASPPDLAVPADLAKPSDMAMPPDMAVDPCKNGKKDGNETDVDCGGGTCAPCVAGKACAIKGDCLSPSVCLAGTCSFGFVLTDPGQTAKSCQWLDRKFQPLAPRFNVSPGVQVVGPPTAFACLCWNLQQGGQGTRGETFASPAGDDVGASVYNDGGLYLGEGGDALRHQKG